MAKRNRIKIVNGWICQINGDKISPVFGDIEIERGLISKIHTKNFEDYICKKTKIKNSDYDAGGRIITVPLVNFHDHFYSRLAKGLPNKKPTDNFQNVLHNLWWNLDKKLTLDMTEASVKMAAVESIKNGVTYIFDHHSSPNSTDGSLGKIAGVLLENKLRGVLCFETSDRNGAALSQKGLDENINFLKKYSGDNIKSILGLHASFTLSDDTLIEAAELVKEHDLGIHIHLCEDKSDRTLSKQYTDEYPVRRLAKNKLLNIKSILGHGIYLTNKEYQIISQAGSAIVYNPDSNMNNAVGLPQYSKAPREITILTGTDGMHANIAQSMKQIFLLIRNQGNNFNESFGLIKKIYFDQISFVKKYFPDFPDLIETSRADMIIWDYIPPTPLTDENFWSHFIYGMTERNISSVIQEGEYLYKDYNLTMINENELFKEIYEQGKKLFLLYK
jgi:cytosine/adenosine deaminase-related metal-dependent hydrolase